MATHDFRISRRELLRTAAAGTLALTGVTMAAEPQDPGDIDCHSHVWTPDVQSYPLAPGQTVADLAPKSFTPEELLAISVPLGVKRVVLIQHTIYHAYDNTYITDVIRKFPGTFSGVACVDPSTPHPDLQIDKLRKQGIRGLRIRQGDGGIDRWSENDGMKLMWKHAPTVGVAMCPLINPDYLPEVHAMCRSFPDATVVIDHFARIGIDGTFRDADLDNLVKLARFKNTHVKISAFYALGRKQPPHDELIPMIRRLYDAYGPGRLMWGSDSPYQLTPPNTYADSVKLIREGIPFLTADDKRLLMRTTAEKVFFT